MSPSARCARVLKAGGFFVFSTFGPDTLNELRSAWAQADGHNHVNHFIDMHDVGSALMRAGLAEPVLDVDRIELDYPDARALMRDLKCIGAHNVTAGRPRALTGRARLARMEQAYEAYRRGGSLPATYEVIYGASWGAAAGEPHARRGDRHRRAARYAGRGGHERARRLHHRHRYRGRQDRVALALVRGLRAQGLRVAVMKPVAIRVPTATAAGTAQRRCPGAGAPVPVSRSVPTRISNPVLLRTGRFRRTSLQKRPGSRSRPEQDRASLRAPGRALPTAVVVEGTGGWFAPIGERGTMADIAWGSRCRRCWWWGCAWVPEPCAADAGRRSEAHEAAASPAGSAAC